MIRWLARILFAVFILAACNTAHAEDLFVDLRGVWIGKVIRHVTQQGFVPYYSGLKLVIEEQNNTQFKGYLIDDVGRDETKTSFTGAVDLNNEYLYLRLASGDIRTGQIVTDNHLLLFAADSEKDTVTVFKLRKLQVSLSSKNGR